MRRRCDTKILAIPGVLGTGLFVGMADLLLVGDEQFRLIEERVNNRVKPEAPGERRYPDERKHSN